MKKKALLVLVILLNIVSCRVKLNNYYSGIVVDELNRSIDAVLVSGNLNAKNRVLTDENGYFKLARDKQKRRQYHPALVLEKSGYIKNSLPIKWSMGWRTQYNKVIRQDSSIIVLKGDVNHELPLQEEISDKNRIFDTIINSHFSFKDIEGTWLKNGPKELNGLRFNSNGLYVFGVKGNRYISYNIINDTLTLFVAYKQVAKGLIKQVKEDELQVSWPNEIITYNRYDTVK